MLTVRLSFNSYTCCIQYKEGSLPEPELSGAPEPQRVIFPDPNNTKKFVQPNH
jgi:hypothetical protein